MGYDKPEQAKAIVLGLKLTGQVVEHKGVLKIDKDARRSTDDAYSERPHLKPGEKVQYRIVVENIDENGVARNLKLQDFLPQGLTYVAGSGQLTKPNGETISLSDGVTSGMVILSELKPHEKVIFTFWANTADTFQDGNCVTNRAQIWADNVTESKQDSADTCFIKTAPTPTPTPVTTPTPTPQPHPTLPHTGPEGSLLASALVSGFGLSTGRYALMKRKLKKAARSIDVA
jgi:uncharacterized repeat protein (TIGR01451 family)